MVRGRGYGAFCCAGLTGAYWSGEAVGRKILDVYGSAGQEVKEETEEPFLQQTPS